MSDFVVIGKKGINRDQILYIEKEDYSNGEFWIIITFVNDKISLKFKDKSNRDNHFKMLVL